MNNSGVFMMSVEKKFCPSFTYVNYREHYNTRRKK